jgi:hypothetical protein
MENGMANPGTVEDFTIVVEVHPGAVKPYCTPEKRRLTWSREVPLGQCPFFKGFLS